MATRLLCSAALICAGATVAAGQQPPPVRDASTPAFEVASVRANTSREVSASIDWPPGGRFTAINFPLLSLIASAYQVRTSQIESAPAWVASARYDIAARASGDFPPAAAGDPPAERLMLRALLADRFKLSARIEVREVPIYALTVARTHGRLGPQLTPTTVDCAALRKAAAEQGGPPQPRALVNGRIPPCGGRTTPDRIEVSDFPMSQLATMLSGYVGRTVVDRTGLSGTYDLLLTFLREPSSGAPPAAQPPLDSPATSIFTAVQEQLGLKLEPARGPVQVLVIERVERPTDD